MVPLMSMINGMFGNLLDWRIYLARNWASIVGDLHEQICLEKIGENGCLIIGVHNTHWLQELHCLSADIIATINRHLPEPHVRQVRLVLSRSRHPFAARKKLKTRLPGVSVKTVHTKKQLTGDQCKALQFIVDEETRAALRTLMELSR